MGASVPVTPINPASAEDRTWRVTLFTDHPVVHPGEDPAAEDYVLNFNRERREYDADGKDVVEPVKEEIEATETDGGKPCCVSLMATALEGATGIARVLTSPDGVEFTLAQVRGIIVTAIESIAADNKQNRMLKAQLDAGSITQEQYDIAIADLIVTEV